MSWPMLFDVGPEHSGVLWEKMEEERRPSGRVITCA